MRQLLSAISIAIALAAVVSGQPSEAPAGESIDVDRAPVPRPVFTDTVRNIWMQTIVRSRVTARQLAIIEEQVGLIWGPYGVRFSWSDRVPPRDSDDTSLRILFDEHSTVLRSRASRHNPAIAAIVFLAPGIPRDIVHASMRGARALFENSTPRSLAPAVADAVIARILGRAIAHEVGHFLLGSPGHAHAGLMRASYDRGDVLAAGMDRFRLEPAELALLRHLNATLVARQELKRRPVGAVANDVG